MSLTVTREIPPVTTLVFDLDGTLLDIDMPAFMKAYFSLACRRFVRPPELPRITPAMAGATRKMAACRNGTHTLDRVFLKAFSPAVKRPPIDVRGVLTAFHQTELEQLRRHTAPRPAARPLLETALALGYELAIATNPVFFLEAIRARIRWAGLEGIPFTLITSAEIMRCAKPHQGYFAQTLRLLGRRADECLLIGDDPAMDLPAGRLGIGTWLAIPEPEECLAVPGADLRGTLEELALWLDARGPAPGSSHPASGPPATQLAPVSSRAVEEEIDAGLANEGWAPPKRIGTLRGMIEPGRLKPRYSVWLWIRIMRAVAERHAANTVFGCISPDTIFIDGENNVRIEKTAPCSRRIRRSGATVGPSPRLPVRHLLDGGRSLRTGRRLAGVLGEEATGGAVRRHPVLAGRVDPVLSGEGPQETVSHDRRGFGSAHETQGRRTGLKQRIFSPIEAVGTVAERSIKRARMQGRRQADAEAGCCPSQADARSLTPQADPFQRPSCRK